MLPDLNSVHQLKVRPSVERLSKPQRRQIRADLLARTKLERATVTVMALPDD